MELVDYFKIVIGIVGYLFIAPLLGFLIRNYRPGQLLCFVSMLVGTAFHTDQITLTVLSVNHTGHTRGFEISFMVFCAIILVVASVFGRRSEFKLVPPGLFFFAAFCIVGLLTLILTVPIAWPRSLIDLESNGDWVNGMYIWEAMFKFSQLTLVFIAAHAFVRSKSDILWFCRAMAIALIIAGTYALYDRYVGGVHRVRGTFDHSNALGIWAYLGALPCLAVSFHKKVPPFTTILLLTGFSLGAIAAVLTISRATQMILAVLSLFFVIHGVATHRNRKAFTLLIAFSLFAGIAAYKAKDTIQERVAGAKLADAHDKEEEIEDLRIVLGRQSALMLGDSFMGIGWNNYQVACSRPVLRYSAVLEEHEAADGDNHSVETFLRNPTVESLYWYLLAETGYLGFACFVLFLGSTLWLMMKAYWRYRGTWLGDFLLSAVIVLSALYAHSHLEKVLLQTKNIVPWFALLAIASKLETIRRRGNGAINPQTRESVHLGSPIEA